MIAYLLELQLGHWLIVVGSALVVLGLVGIVIGRKQPETPTPDEVPSPDGSIPMPSFLPPRPKT
jgi:hypothetical protein